MLSIDDMSFADALRCCVLAAFVDAAIFAA